MNQNKKKNLIVFDFDMSLTDYYSDNWAIGTLDKEFNECLSETIFDQPWYLVMTDLFNRLHRKGFTKQDLINNLKKFPLHPNIIQLIQTSKLLNFDFVIISDGNELFLNEILTNHQVRHYIDHLITNRVTENLDQSLNLVPFLDPLVDKPHGCKYILSNRKKLCHENLCKGTELKKLMEQNEYHRVIYTGDGGNDFCPMLQLRSQDMMCIRRGFQLEFLYNLEKSNFDIQSQVKFWYNAEDLFNIFETEIFSEFN